MLFAESKILFVVNVAKLKELQHTLSLVLVLDLLSLLRIFYLGLVFDE